MNRVVFAVGSLACAAFACQLVAGIERTDKIAPPPPDAEPDTFVSDPCAHADVPPLPDKDDDPATTLAPQYLALRTLQLMPRNGDGGFLGLDLDGVCTCDTRPGSAEGGASSCVANPKADTCDEPAGVDNQLAKVLDPYLGTIGGSLDQRADIQPHIDEGRQDMLVYLASYNGQPNDRDVQLGVFLSNGIADPSGCNNVEDLPRDPLGGPRYQPKWCGSDIWTIDPRAAILPAKVPNFIGHGYVNDGVLVARLDAVTIYFGTLPLKIGGFRVRGKLQKVGSSWHLDDAIMTGRMAITDMLTTIGTFTFGDQDAGRFLCREPLWAPIRDILCQNGDLAESERFDFQGRPCAAFSLAFAFTAESAALGDTADAGDDPNPCAGDAAPPGSYVCPP